MGFYIWDNVHSEPAKYPYSWNSTTGEILSVGWVESSSIDFGSSDARAAAITKINNCAANAGKFIGSVPPKHP